MKILIIEDEILIQKSLVKILQGKGHQVYATAKGKEAIQLILEYKFDRILCDLMLQDITGFDILEESRAIYTQKQIANTFIILTAYNSPQIINKASAYDCPILQKPFDNLAETLDLLLMDREHTSGHHQPQAN